MSLHITGFYHDILLMAISKFEQAIHELPRRNLNIGAVIGRANLRSFRNGICPWRLWEELNEIPPIPGGPHRGRSSSRRSSQRTRFPWLPALNSEIHRWFISKPKWDASWLHAVADHKFAMVHCSSSQENRNAIILIYVAETFHWVGLKVFFERESPAKGVKNQIL